VRSGTNGLWIGAGTKVRAHSKASPDLIGLHGEYQTYLEQPQAKGRGASGCRSANVLARVAAGHAVVDLVASGDPQALAADLGALGLRNAAVFGHMVSGRLPIPALENLASLAPSGS
jgi:hypothetical protein